MEELGEKLRGVVGGEKVRGEVVGRDDGVVWVVGGVGVEVRKSEDGERRGGVGGGRGVGWGD